MVDGFRDVDVRWMRQTLDLAETAAQAGEVPVGALVVKGKEVVGRGANRTRRDQDPTAHAEILAVRAAAAHMGSWGLEGCTVYVTLEPCAMCAGSLVLARVDRLVFGTADPKAGACGSLRNIVADRRLNHRIEVQTGVLQEACSDILKQFFRTLRNK